jgi:hypothetical protein
VTSREWQPTPIDEIQRRASLSPAHIEFLSAVRDDIWSTGRLPQESEMHRKLIQRGKRDVLMAGLALPEWLLLRHQRDHGDLSLSLTALRLAVPDAVELKCTWAVIGCAIKRYTTTGDPDAVSSTELEIVGAELRETKRYVEHGYVWFLRANDQPDGSTVWKIDDDIDPYLEAASLDDVIGIVETRRFADAQARLAPAMFDEMPTPRLDAPMVQLRNAPLPEHADRVVVERLRLAEERFFRLGATDDDRRDALVHLAAALEHLRDRLADVLLDKKDDDALFTIANNFAIRHENVRQRREYATAWLVWIFHVYWATVRVGLELLDDNDRSAPVVST